MSVIFITIIFLAICIAYGYARMSDHNDFVYSAFAGSSDEPHDSSYPTVITEPSRVIQLDDGTYKNTKSFHRLRINGNCMAPIDINNGDEWLATKFNRKKSLKSQVKVNDVLFIYLPDTKRYKIRRVRKFIDDKTVDTYSYNEDRTEHSSSRPHSTDTIKGILRYRINH